MNTDIHNLVSEEMRGLTTGQCFSKLVDYLVDRQRAKRQLAVELLVNLGTVALSSLMRDAMLLHRRPRQCAAILDVVAKIGGPLNVDDWMKLSMLLHSRHEAVRKKAAGVMIALHQAHRFPAVPTPMAGLTARPAGLGATRGPLEPPPHIDAARAEPDGADSPRHSAVPELQIGDPNGH